MIKVENVVKHYYLGQRKVVALNGVSLQINEGQFIAVQGPSGSGKSTLLHLMGCLDVPTQGQVKILKKNTSELSDRKQSELRNKFLGFIFQSFNLIPVLSAFENIEYPLLLQGVSRSKRKDRVNRLLQDVGLEGHAKHYPDTMSGGQRQRVAIARALITQPRVVLADEPTANLDSVTGTEILDLMKIISLEKGTSFVFSTHDPKIIPYAEIVYTLKDGVLTT
ncbi:MAG: ABC transporter ATP-binding protein [Methylococcaceae bacterium]|nr:ABC transporter ATP-binding protein [Methylococcaceae bacterium]